MSGALFSSALPLKLRLFRLMRSLASQIYKPLKDNFMLYPAAQPQALKATAKSVCLALPCPELWPELFQHGDLCPVRSNIRFLLFRLIWPRLPYRKFCN